MYTYTTLLDPTSHSTKSAKHIECCGMEDICHRTRSCGEVNAPTPDAAETLGHVRTTGSTAKWVSVLLRAHANFELAHLGNLTYPTHSSLGLGKQSSLRAEAKEMVRRARANPTAR